MKAILQMVLPIEQLYLHEQQYGKAVTVEDFKCTLTCDQTLGSVPEWNSRMNAHIANGDIIPGQIFAEDTLVPDPDSGTYTVSFRWENKDAAVEFLAWRRSDACDLPKAISYAIVDIPDTP